MSRDGRPWSFVLQLAVILLAIGIARISNPHSWIDPGGFLVVIGAGLTAWYFDSLARWLKR